MGPGLWFEAALIRRDTDLLLLRHERFLTLGLDYTLDIGNGLGVVVEHLVRDFGGEFWESDRGLGISALALNYSLGLHDSLDALVYYDWTGQEAYVQLSWKKVYDRWTFYLIGFSNPDRDVLGLEEEGSFFAAGKGAMVVFSFSH